LLKAGIPGSCQRRQDPPASCHDLHVALALQSHLKLVGAVACPDQVSMWVHKPWHNRAPSQVNTISVGIALQDFSFSPNSKDDFIFANNRTLLDHAELT